MSQKRSVLLVDDSKFARLLVKAFITSNFSDWHVDEAEEAEQAQAMAAEKDYDYFLIDFNMPGMNGLELGEKLRAAYPDAAIALLTANIQKEIQNKAAGLGMDFLAKPPTEEKICDYLAGKEAGR
ncbi:response regulator transcription factor [Thalassospira australica]|uniref:response regulator transcription factor n=1 Tax=Thalassospira australica TaxID=1528106 RepID=UPI00384F10F8